jgi:hypothetical protein
MRNTYIRTIGAGLPCLILGLEFLLGGTNHAAAAPINYDEATAGDLPHFASPLSTFALDLGTNTVRGRFGTNDADFPEADFDSFAFTLAAGASIVSATVELLDVSDGDILRSHWMFRSGSTSVGGGAAVKLLSVESPGKSSLGIVVFGEGEYNFSHEGFDSLGGLPSFSDYVFTFEVVPEPASSQLALYAVGMLLVISARRRRSSRGRSRDVQGTCDISWNGQGKGAATPVEVESSSFS